VPDRPTPDRLQALLHQLGHGLLERDTAVRLALLAALAGEHVLLIGPPGTAKSALARRLHRAFDGARYFERLLTRFSTPEELFGPLSLKALEHDRYERLTDGFLPTAGIAFLDEVFKANSAILNALLTLLNEREFDNGTKRLSTPLIAVVAASNEVPTDDALQAFHDRFLVRVPVAPVGDASFEALLQLGPAAAGADEAGPLPARQHAAAHATTGSPTPDPPPGQPQGEIPPDPMPAAALRAEERDAIAQAAAQVRVGQAFIAACQALRSWLAARQMPLSDRRWRQFVHLAQTAAATEGRGELDAIDLWCAPYVASTRPQEVPALQVWFIDEALQSPPTAAPWLERAVEAFEKQLGLEQQAQAEGSGGPDDGAGKLALARAIGMNAQPDAEPSLQRIVSNRLEDKLRKRWGRHHVEARVAQVGQIEAELASWLDEVHHARDALAHALARRLWMPADLKAHALARHDAALAQLAAWAQRLADARRGFAALPIEEDGSAVNGVEPPPVSWARAA
jgi:MoxR-like ATPase